MKYANICVAGTFDGLHAGHEALLMRAFAESGQVCIGVTSDDYVKRYKKRNTRPYDVRRSELTSWLEKNGFAGRASIIPIHDPFEPAASDPYLTALVVSADSQKRGDELNTLRKRRGLDALTLLVVPMVHADDAQPISATRVAAGEIDRTGKLLMPESLREELVRPLGDLINGAAISASFMRNSDRIIMTVGDQTTKTVLDAGLTPALMVIDNKVNRRDFTALRPILAGRGFLHISVSSGPGFISNEAIAAIRDALTGKKPGILVEVNGEEDLLAIPVIIEAPPGAVVYYGQPHTPGSPKSGIVEVIVTEKVKTVAETLLSRFLS